MLHFKRMSRYTVPLAFALVTGATETTAQDAHYWSNQYGTRGNLLGGAVVGSALDISAVYYNPGGLSLITGPELLATSKVFEAVDVSVQGSGDLDLELSDLSLGVAPGFFAGLVPLGELLPLASVSDFFASGLSVLAAKVSCGGCAVVWL